SERRGGAIVETPHPVRADADRETVVGAVMPKPGIEVDRHAQRLRERVVDLVEPGAGPGIERHRDSRVIGVAWHRVDRLDGWGQAFRDRQVGQTAVADGAHQSGAESAEHLAATLTLLSAGHR